MSKGARGEGDLEVECVAGECTCKHVSLWSAKEGARASMCRDGLRGGGWLHVQAWVATVCEGGCTCKHVARRSATECARASMSLCGLTKLSCGTTHSTREGAGESYAGVYVPLAAKAVLAGNDQGQTPFINLRVRPTCSWAHAIFECSRVKVQDTFHLQYVLGMSKLPYGSLFLKFPGVRHIGNIH